MSEIRVIETRPEREAFRELARYCFVDTVGWIDRVPPAGAREGAAYGVFEGDRLLSALISRNYACSLFGETAGMAGISAVATWPEERGKSRVSELMAHAIRRDREEGKSVSSLYPFKFSFYEKYGYGFVGESSLYRFSPYDVRGLTPPGGEWAAFDGSPEMFGGYLDVFSRWARSFDFACLPALDSRDELRAQLDADKEHCYLLRTAREVKAVLRYALVVTGPFSKRMEVRRAAWTDAEGFRGIFHFFVKHRDQVPEIDWRTCGGLGLHHMTGEPRIYCAVSRDWMARPLDLPGLLARRAEAEGFKGPAEISITDDLIESNTGTYLIEDGGVKLIRRKGGDTIGLPLFSSLLFGGMTYREAVLAGHVLEPALEPLFARRRPVWLTERF
jgi:predicted acetyltransferase